ncbi:O-antigen ligase family protein [Alishewanella tabrizica]|uniref:O-antigen ligase family protein n=1 Tax=Alishewanella tabrizica TaxID=671278 RepID=UPI00167217E8|nr:O-antigen ligase family protein [Alishewanella tabrizica]
MATCTAVGLIFALYQHLNPNHSIKTKILISAYIIISPLIITLCSSRTAYISLALGLTIFFACNAKEVFKNQLSSFFKLSAGIFLAALYFLLVDTGHKDLESLKTPGIRLDMYLNSLLMFIEKPFLGWGFGEYIHAFYYSIYDNSNIYDFINPIDSLSTHPHNELALWGLEGGIIGLIFICTILYIFLKALLKSKRSSDIMRGSGFVILLPLFFHVMLEHPLYTSSLYGLYFCLIFYIYTSPEYTEQNTFYTKSISVIFAIQSTVLVPALIIVLQSSILSSAYLKTGSSAIREMIISDFPSKLYLVQMDLLLETHNARVNDDYSSLEALNNQIFETIKTIPAKSLATDYLTNCKIITNCKKDKIEFINRYFNTF